MRLLRLDHEVERDFETKIDKLRESYEADISQLREALSSVKEQRD